MAELPRAFVPRGHIQPRQIQGTVHYLVSIPVEHKRGGKRISRTYHDLAQAEEALEHMRAQMMAEFDAEPIVRLPESVAPSGVLPPSAAKGVHEPVVYFVRLPPFGHIKIGVSKNLGSRLHDFGSILDNVELLACEGGGTQRERELHIRFAASRIPGTERFIPTEELLAYIAALPQRVY